MKKVEGKQYRGRTQKKWMLGTSANYDYLDRTQSIWFGYQKSKNKFLAMELFENPTRN